MLHEQRFYGCNIERQSGSQEVAKYSGGPISRCKEHIIVGHFVSKICP